MLTFDLDKPVGEQMSEFEAICRLLLSKYVTFRLEIVQISPANVLLASHEELNLIKTLATRFKPLTVRQIVSGMRQAATDKAKWYSKNPTAFTKLYVADLEEGVRLKAIQIQIQKEKNEESEAAKQLPATTSNAFWGTPAEALDREWPKIMTSTQEKRELFDKPRYVYRFWITRNEEEKKAINGMFREMTTRLEASGKWTIGKGFKMEHSYFVAEYIESFPDWQYLVDQLVSVRDPEQVATLRKKTETKIMAIFASANGKNQPIPNAPQIANFPNPVDAIYGGIFNAYWQYTLDQIEK